MVTVHRHAHMNKSVWYLFSMLSFHINQCDFFFKIIFRPNKSVIYRIFPVRYYVPFQSILQFQALTLIHETCDPIKCCRGICERNQVYTQNTSRQIDNDLQTNKKKCSTLWFCSWIFQSHRFFSTMFSQYSHDIHLELWIFIANAEKNSNVFFLLFSLDLLLWLDHRNATHTKNHYQLNAQISLTAPSAQWCFRFNRNDGSPFRLLWKTLLRLERSDTSIRFRSIQCQRWRCSFNCRKYARIVVLVPFLREIFHFNSHFGKILAENNGKWKFDRKIIDK